MQGAGIIAKDGPMRQEAIVGGLAATGSRSLLRRMNSLGILRELMSGPRSLSELAAASGISRTAVDAVIADLVQLGWATQVERTPATAGPGRPAAVYGVAPEAGHLLSIDIGANHIYAMLTDLVGTQLADHAVRVRDSDDAETRLDAAFGVVEEVLTRSGRSAGDVWVIAVGSPGAISDDGVVQYFGGEGMPGWSGLDLRSAFEQKYGVAVLVESDVPLGAHAELSVGAARGMRDAVYVLCGVRTSGAVIIDGKVHRGAHGGAGLVGELPQLRWLDLNERYGQTVLPSPRPTREQIFEAARQGDPAARAAVDEFADFLATGTAAMVLALDPEIIVIGGGSSPSADVFLPRFTETLEGICPMPVRAVASTLGSEAVALGGLSLATTALTTALETAVQEAGDFPSPAATRELLRAR
jgi:predicted NBD/HSP70 family sugar kinase